MTDSNTNLRMGRRRESEEKKNRKIGCILFILCSSDLEGGPGTSALYLHWHEALRIIILMNIYLYMFLDLFCSEGFCLGWLARDRTIWLSSGRF